ACAPELPPGKRPQHLTRAACELLAGRGEVELFFKSRARKQAQTRIDQLRWVRLPGKRERWYEAPGRPRGRPERPPKNPRPPSALEARVSPETTAPIEAVILRLLGEDISEVDLLASANTPWTPPGDGWKPHSWVVTRACFRVTITPGSRYNMIGLSLRRLGER